MDESTALIAQINSLENGKGLQYLLNESYRIFGNPSVLFNMEYELIACTENIVTDDPLWNELVGNGVFCSETIDYFISVGFSDEVANTETTVLLHSDLLTYDRFFGRVVNSDDSTVIDLIMVACHMPFGDDLHKAVEALCDKLSKEISSIEFYQHYGVVYHESMIRRLLDNGNDDKFFLLGHVANLYEGLKTNLFVAVVDISKCNFVNCGPESLRDLFKKTQAELKYAVYSDYIVIIISTDDDFLNTNRDLNKLITLFEHNNVYAGISGRFENMFDLRKHYNEAVDVLKQGLRTNSHQRVYSYYDIRAE